jgi:hypothetical protein
MTKKPRTLKDLREDPRVDTIHTEYDGYGDGLMAYRKSYWLYLKPGQYCVPTEGGTIHEKSIRACCEKMEEVITGRLVDGWTCAPAEWLHPQREGKAPR